MRRTLASMLALAGSAFVAGCTAGPTVMLESTTDYNRAVRQVQNEELLLNIVRMRYAEAPQFVQVSGITTQFQTTTGIGGNLGWSDGLGGAAGAGVDGSISFTDSPTISLTPRQGEQVVRQILGGIDPEDIALLSDAGYRLDHLLVVLAEQVNGVRSIDVGGSLPPRGGEIAFAEMVADVRALLQRDELVCGFLKAYDEYEHSVPVDSLKPADYLAAIQSGKRWKELDGGDGAAALHTYGLEPIIWISRRGRESAEGRRLIETLTLDPDAPFYWIDDAKFQTRPTERTDVIRIRMRSFYGVLNLLAHAVAVPPTHQADGMALARMAPDETLASLFEERLGEILSIRATKGVPERPFVAVRHHDYWFFIDERDLRSKRAFSLAAELFNLEVGDVGGSGGGPLLTLPLD